jgi:bifunctional non-homologous end joining protein LigD
MTGDQTPIEVDGRELVLSNLDKVLYPAVRFTKRDVLSYYRTVAPCAAAVPARPSAGDEAVSGGGGRAVVLREAVSAVASGLDHIDYCVIDDLATLLWVANLADLEMHTLLATTADLTMPTMLVFDLDPGPGAGLVESARVALWLRESPCLQGLSTSYS